MNEIRQLTEPAVKVLWTAQASLQVVVSSVDSGQPQSTGDGGYTRLST